MLLFAAAGLAQAQGPVPDYRAALRESQAAIGRTVGDYTLRDADGRAVRLRDLRGQPLVISFIYTGCFQVCPTSTRFLAEAVVEARRALGAETFRVASIGFNQPFDDPAAMAAFARGAGIRDPRWHFLSPDPKDVAALTRDLGFVYEATPKGFDHITQVTIVDAAGVVYRQVYGERFELPMLVGPLKELLTGQIGTSLSLDEIWTRVKLYCTVYDPQTGAYRVNYSLFFEIFAGMSVLAAIAWVLLRERLRARAATRGRPRIARAESGTAVRTRANAGEPIRPS